MSNKSGVASQVVPLPGGGGALQGIGETFTADPFTGTGTCTVPIAMPAGRNGFQPALSLSYDTGAGNGPFGLGWSVSVPEVSRRTSRGIPRYDEDPPDTFLLSGAEDLVPVDGGARYRPRTEGLFARIERLRTDSDIWRVRTRDGTEHRYGEGDAVVADPAAPGHVFCWKLTVTVDPFGNRIEYAYLRDGGQLYLSRVRYVDYQHDGQTQFLASVGFVYEGRPDPFSDHRPGFAVRTRLRCRRIEVRTHPDGDDRLLQTYELSYVDELPSNGVSLLSRVHVTGHDRDRTEALPPLEFRYAAFDPRDRPVRPVEGTGGTLPRRSLADDDLELVDVLGNGLPDIVEMNGSTRFWRNLGNGLFDTPRSMPEVPAGVRLGDAGTRFADMNGDGRADLLVLDRGGYFPLGFDGRWSPEGFVRYRTAPSVPLADGNLRLVDLDGDGVVDALRTGAAFELFRNDPAEGWTDVQTRQRGPIEEFPDVSFADPRVQLADLDGDGLQDIVLVAQGRIDYWPYLGHGRWGRRITMAGSPVFRDRVLPPGRFDPRRVLLGDLDGDGLDDIVYMDADRITIWINQSGNGFGEPIVIEGTPRFADADAVRLVDLLGHGTAGVLWTADAPGGHRFADLTGGVKPYLLTEVDNHQGARTRVRYATSTAYYLADAADPTTRWRTPLPFPVHVVAAVEAVDEISDGRLTTEYRYHHGYFDGVEREFRGFGMVEQLDTEVVDDQQFTSPLRLRTWFHLGPVGDEFADRGEADYASEYWQGDPSGLERPSDTAALLASLPASARAAALRALRGHALRTELYADDGTDRADRPYTVTEAQYGLRQEDPGVFFPHPVSARTTQWERGSDPMHQFQFTDSYDGYGQPGRLIALAVPRGRDFTTPGPAGQPYLGTSTVTTYAQRDDAGRYLVDRVAGSTTYEIRNDGSPALADVLAQARAGRRLAIAGQSLTYYDGEPFTGLPLGEIGDFGVPVRTEELVLTEEILGRAYPDADGVGVPPYLVPSSSPAWTGDHPAAFREALPALAGYVFSPGDADRERGWFVASSRQRHDTRGLPVASRDPMGNETTVEHDRFGLLPVLVTDAQGLRTRTQYNYRVMAPELVTDANGNRTAFTYTPLGLLATTAVMGKEGEPVGDTPAAPGTRILYDLSAFDDGRRPVAVRTIRRIHHANDPDVPVTERDRIIETVSYSDGLGRAVQTRSRAEDIRFGDTAFGGGVVPAEQNSPDARQPVTGRRNADEDRPAVVISGAQTYDSKGRVVEAYEPFFGTGWDYEPVAEARRGERVEMSYDPRGQLVRTLDPDGSQRLVCFGTPADLADPGTVEPTPWEAYTYDANDNAGRTHGDAAAAYREHWDTPASIVLDALGHTVSSTERTAAEEVRTQHRYDIHGNLVALVDTLGRTAFRYVHDLTGRILRTEGVDAGVRRQVHDAAGGIVESRDGRGALALSTFDRLRRPVLTWARDDEAGVPALRERSTYGDDGDSAQRAAARDANRLGCLHTQHDQAGLLRHERYDHRGNLVTKVRRVVADDEIQVDRGRDVRLEAGEYETAVAYDALDRVRWIRYPRDVEGRRRELRPEYDQAGGLERVTLDGRVFVDRIAYNARGQRTLVALGNGVLTRYAYDPRTARLTRLRTERWTNPDALSYLPAGRVLQDTAYEYDLVGNLLGTVERVPGCGIAANPDAGRTADPRLRAEVAGGDALIRRFTYDPLYRLLTATGRACAERSGQAPWADPPRCGFDGAGQDNAPQLTASCRESYAYDRAGNLSRLRRAVGGDVLVRQYRLAAGTNRLESLTTADTTFGYAYDRNGNLVAEGESRRFAWDHADRLAEFRVQAGSAEPSVHVRYRYDPGGRRVRKVVRKQSGAVEVTTYIDDAFEHHRWSGGPMPAGATNHLHVTDDQQRIVIVRLGAPHPADRGPAIQFQLADHLGSSAVVVDDTGGFVNREETSPYGEATFGGFGRKRFRFTGQERDEESGLDHSGVRMYASWLGRWTSCDPAGLMDGPNLYRYARGNPIGMVDPDGTQPVLPEDRETQWRRGPFESSFGPAQADPAPLPIDFGNDLSGEVFIDDIVVPEPEKPKEEDSSFGSRLWGAVKIIGGFGLAAAGCFASAGVGCVVAAAIGAGQAGAGLVQAVTGTETRNPIEAGASKALQAAGVSERTADTITQSAEAGYSLAVGAAALRAPAPPATSSAEMQQVLAEVARSQEIADPTFVPVHEIFTVRIKGSPLNSSYRGYNLRSPKIAELKARAQRWGGPQTGHVGHVTAQSVLAPGELGLVRWTSEARNLAASAGERARVQLWRKLSEALGLNPADPVNRFFTRPTKPGR